MFRNTFKISNFRPQMAVVILVTGSASVGRAQSDDINSAKNEAYVLAEQGRYDQAITTGERALRITETSPNPNGLATANCLELLADLNTLNWGRGEAQPLLRRALNIKKTVLGSASPVVKRDEDDLNRFYPEAERDRQRIPAQLASLDAMSKVGPNNNGLIGPIESLAASYQQNGMYAEAEKQFKRSLEIGKTSLPQGNLAEPRTLKALADLSCASGDYKRAESGYQQWVEAVAQVPNNAADKAASLATFARFYIDRGNLEAAEPLVKAGTAGMDVYGLDHPRANFGLNILAYFYQRQGKYDLAEQNLLQLLENTESIYKRSQYFADVQVRLGALYQLAGKYSQAETAYKTAYEIRSRSDDGIDPVSMSIAHNLAWVYAAQKNFSAAESQFKLLLEKTDQRHKGHVLTYYDNIDLSMRLSNLGTLYLMQRKYSEAEPLINRSLEIRESEFPPDHSFIASNLEALAAIYSGTDRKAEASPLESRAAEIRKNQNGPDPQRLLWRGKKFGS